MRRTIEEAEEMGHEGNKRELPLDEYLPSAYHNPLLQQHNQLEFLQTGLIILLLSTQSELKYEPP
jgi:hypothetical protein